MNKSDDTAVPYEHIKVEGNDIFFYCDVCQDSVTELSVVLKKLERDLFVATYGLDVVPCVRVHIHSDGGDLMSGLGCMDFMKRLKLRVVTIVEGLCASAATFIFLGGSQRIVSPNAYVLIHQLSSDCWGTYENMKDEMKFCEQLMRRLKRIYLKETSLPEKKLDRLMKRDLYLSHRKCVRYGLEKFLAQQ